MSKATGVSRKARPGAEVVLRLLSHLQHRLDRGQLPPPDRIADRRNGLALVADVGTGHTRRIL